MLGHDPHSLSLAFVYISRRARSILVPWRLLRNPLGYPVILSYFPSLLVGMWMETHVPPLVGMWAKTSVPRRGSFHVGR